MLMHSCYCIFISVTGGFVQMLEDFKNLLKMSLKILFIKRKRKFPSISSPSSHSAQHQPQPSSPPLFPARPSFAQPSNPTSHAQPSSCACTRTRQPPAQHRAPASRAQPLTARPRPSARPPPLPAPSEPPGHVARPQPPPWRRGSALPRVPRLLFKRSRAPPPRVSLSRSPLHFRLVPGCNCRTEELRGLPSAVRVVVFPEPPSTPSFPVVSFALFPSLSPCCLFLISWLLVVVFRAPVEFSPPAMAPAPRPSPPAVFST